MTDLQLEDVQKKIRKAFKTQFGFAPKADTIVLLEGSYDQEHEDRCTWFELDFAVNGKGWYYNTETEELRRVENQDYEPRKND